MSQSFIGKVNFWPRFVRKFRVVEQITSNKMMKSVVVTVTYLRKLPKYHVYRKFQSKIMAHDELSECKIGDTVRIQSCRPLSKRKAFRVTELLSRANQYDEETKKDAKHKSSIAEMKAEERRNALANELMSRRQFMNKEAIEKAEEEMKQQAPLRERNQASIAALKTIKTRWYSESSSVVSQLNDNMSISNTQHEEMSSEGQKASSTPSDTGTPITDD